MVSQQLRAAVIELAREAGRATMTSYDAPADAARWAVAAMELGALVCRARAPRCSVCPVSGACAWRAAGCPEPAQPPRAQTYAGTDRQVRGRLLAVLRERSGPADAAALAACWDAAAQRERALAGLLADGLVETLPDGTYRLPGRPTSSLPGPSR